MDYKFKGMEYWQIGRRYLILSVFDPVYGFDSVQIFPQLSSGSEMDVLCNR